MASGPSTSKPGSSSNRMSLDGAMTMPEAGFDQVHTDQHDQVDTPTLMPVE